jgi:hypothetical protein
MTFDEAIARTSYTERMRSVSIPPGWGYQMPSSLLGLPNLIVTWISPDGRLLALERSLHRAIRTMFLDTGTLQLTEYCAGRSAPWRAWESPDGRFLLWTDRAEWEDEGSSSTETLDAVVVLDLTTGRYATIEGAEALGWAVIGP